MSDLNRRYFIMTIPNNEENNALDICIGDNTTQKYNLDSSELLIKTTQENIDVYLSGSTESLGIEYTYEEICSVLSGPNWLGDVELSL